jgi:hypothetical protein
VGQLVRFIVVDLIHTGSNPRFDMSVVFTANYFLVEDDVLIDNDVFSVTDFMNLKIKLTQSSRGAHMSRVCMRVFIQMSAHMCMIICICTVFIPEVKTKFYKVWIT